MVAKTEQRESILAKQMFLAKNIVNSSRIAISHLNDKYLSDGKHQIYICITNTPTSSTIIKLERNTQ